MYSVLQLSVQTLQRTVVLLNLVISLACIATMHIQINVEGVTVDATRFYRGKCPNRINVETKLWLHIAQLKLWTCK